ncbi:ribonuclease HII [Brachyspira pilosicoli B2904]|uniref:Ribonuclease n=1 Tax=Brachyspira pilosicoli B2904 TaxID=1133568 RepID=J9UI13_BRAPL|nr:ribonuclease HII [Brachyspira pilosicoli]AFR69875.1 ribonuclease HII [Brachyspira pilosicoli B2904]
MYFFDNEENEEIDKLHYEKYYLDLGYKYICGIDEVGRGSLFGEVTACAVIMPLDDDIIKEANDSKKLTAKKEKSYIKLSYKKHYHIQYIL